MRDQRQRRRQRGVGGDVGEIAGRRSGPESVRSQGPHENGRHGVRAEPQRTGRQVRMFTGRRRDLGGKSCDIFAKFTRFVFKQFSGFQPFSVWRTAAIRRVIRNENNERESP